MVGGLEQEFYDFPDFSRWLLHHQPAINPLFFSHNFSLLGLRYASFSDKATCLGNWEEFCENNNDDSHCTIICGNDIMMWRHSDWLGLRDKSDQTYQMNVFANMKMHEIHLVINFQGCPAPRWRTSWMLAIEPPPGSLSWSSKKSWVQQFSSPRLAHHGAGISKPTKLGDFDFGQMLVLIFQHHGERIWVRPAHILFSLWVLSSVRNLWWRLGIPVRKPP